MARFLTLSRPVLMAILAFFSLYSMGFPVGGSAIFSLIPLILGYLGVLTSVAYSITGILLIIACANALLPGIPGKIVSTAQSVLETTGASAPAKNGPQAPASEPTSTSSVASSSAPTAEKKK